MNRYTDVSINSEGANQTPVISALLCGMWIISPENTARLVYLMLRASNFEAEHPFLQSSCLI